MDLHFQFQVLDAQWTSRSDETVLSLKYQRLFSFFGFHYYLSIRLLQFVTKSLKQFFFPSFFQSKQTQSSIVIPHPPHNNRLILNLHFPILLHLKQRLLPVRHYYRRYAQLHLQKRRPKQLLLPVRHFHQRYPQL